MPYPSHGVLGTASIHGSSRQGYRVQGGQGRGATSPDQNVLSNNAS